MKWVVVIAFAVATLLLFIAQVTIPKLDDDNVKTIVWATGENSARREQVKLFEDWYFREYGEKIKLRIDPANKDMSKVIVQSISGEGPDLFDYFGVPYLERYVASGIMLDITDSAKVSSYSKDYVWKSFWPSFVKNGRQYGYPANLANYMILYHKDIFDSLGVPYPNGDWTWYDFLEVAKKLSFTDEEGKKHYAILSIRPLDMILQTGVEMFSSQGTHCTLNDKRAIDALQMYVDFRDKYGVMPTSASLSSIAAAGGSTENLGLFATKRFAMVSAGRYWFTDLAEDTRTRIAEGKAPRFSIGVVKSPYFVRRYNLGGARCVAVNRTGKNIKYALRFIKFLSSHDYNQNINCTYDAMPPSISYFDDLDGLTDSACLPLPSMEAANDTNWISCIEWTHEVSESPFISPFKTLSYWYECKQILDDGNKTPAQVLTIYEKMINDRIKLNVSKKPKLKKKYEEAIKLEQAGTES